MKLIKNILYIWRGQLKLIKKQSATRVGVFDMSWIIGRMHFPLSATKRDSDNQRKGEGLMLLMKYWFLPCFYNRILIQYSAVEFVFDISSRRGRQHRCYKKGDADTICVYHLSQWAYASPQRGRSQINNVSNSNALLRPLASDTLVQCSLLYLYETEQDVKTLQLKWMSAALAVGALEPACLVHQGHNVQQ